MCIYKNLICINRFQSSLLDRHSSSVANLDPWWEGSEAGGNITHSTGMGMGMGTSIGVGTAKDNHTFTMYSPSIPNAPLAILGSPTAPTANLSAAEEKVNTTDSLSSHLPILLEDVNHEPNVPFAGAVVSVSNYAHMEGGIALAEAYRENV